jgi:hypothetical protein
MGINRLKQQIENNCNIIQAVLAFNHSLTPLGKSKLDQIRLHLRDMSTKRLEALDHIMAKDAGRAVDVYGCRMDPIQFTNQFIHHSRSESGVPLLSKADIDTLYFSNFCDGELRWRDFSPHLLLQVHFDRVVIPGEPIIYRWELPEATLFEDMAMAYNSAVELKRTPPSAIDNEADPEVKRRRFFLRTAVLSAFYFVEAFLNGIAFDFCYRNSGTLNEKDRAFLLEIPAGQSKRTFVSFEKKATHYLKVMMGTQHPPLSESNCASLRIMLNEAKELRDSIVHQSPKIHDATGEPDKTKWMLSVDMEKVTTTVDAAVQLVRDISAQLGSHASPLDWLYSRTQEGVFPPESFV